ITSCEMARGLAGKTPLLPRTRQDQNRRRHSGLLCTQTNGQHSTWTDSIIHATTIHFSSPPGTRLWSRNLVEGPADHDNETPEPTEFGTPQHLGSIQNYTH